jgi:outer membrane protein OmpA-like peptidoglycan-associated protein
MLIAAACSKQDAAPARSATSALAAHANSSSTKQKAACELVTASDLSAIVGATLVSDGGNGGDSNTCRFTSSTGTLPSVQVEIDWGGGAAAMTATGLLARHEPGIADPLAGIGDQATAIGPAVWVRVGEDLLNLTLLGVDDGPAVARRIVGLMRPRMGASAQAKDAEAGTAEAEKAGQLVSGLLDGLAAANARSSESAAGTGGSSSVRATPIADEPLRPATGAPVRIPLVAGLTLVGAEYEPGRGDYEPIVTVTAVTADVVTTAFSSNLPEGARLAVKRDVRREDLRMGRSYLSWYHAGDPRVFAGSTSFSVSSAVYAELRGAGGTRIDRLASETNPLAAIARLASGSSALAPAKHRGVLQRVEPHALAFPVLLNDVPREVPVIHARGQFDDATIDYNVLDDPANPLLLRIAGQSVGRIVRISYPADGPSLVDDELAKDGRVEIHGIFFDFGKATIRPESETSLRDIASALARHPTWAVTIEGHTDNVGGDADNVDLSRRRADAVKQALVDRYRVDARTLSTAGRGASQPAAANDTLSGRARNRRVELIRQ